MDGRGSVENYSISYGLYIEALGSYLSNGGHKAFGANTLKLL
jgi:hypothetical protein